MLIVGAGPTGLTAACEALQQGLTVRIIERRAERAPTSRALVLHARTLETLETLGCAQQLVDAGQRFRGLHVVTRPGRRSRYVDLLQRRWGDTRYPFWLSLPQYDTERILEQHLTSLGGAIEWATSLTSIEIGRDATAAALARGDGHRVDHHARWVLGCDGGHSTVRDQARIRLPRNDDGVTFALADIHAPSELPEDEGHVVLGSCGLLFVVPLPKPGWWRLIAQVANDHLELDIPGWNALVRERCGLPLAAQELGWTSTLRLTSGVAERFRERGVFLLGDAAHLYSPVGGQGLNMGIQDAHNLAWKLGLVASAQLTAPQVDAVLDSYDGERRPLAAGMVRTTERATRLLTARGAVRRRLLRSFLGVALMSSRVKDKLGRGVGMLDIPTAGAARLQNPELPAGGRLHDVVDKRRPTLLTWQGEEILVRPDRIVAPPGSIPHSVRINADGGDMC